MRQRPVVESLEPRILYSADLGPVLAPAIIAPAAAEHRVFDAHDEFAAQNEQAVQSAPHEIVFIDARTPDYALLARDIAAQSGRQVEVIMLDAARDGLEQITEVLADRENVAAVHIIAHGGEGVVQLGSNVFNADALERRSLQIEAWRSALTADADILLYGCDIAASAQGQLFVDALARLTDADVSASDDATGHAGLGGDWKLEYATGAIEAPVALSQQAQDAWSHLLPSVVLTSYEPPFANMTDNAYEISGGVTYSQSFRYTSGAGTYTVDQIDLVLNKNASSSGGNVTVELRSALGGGGGSLIASGSVARSSLGTSEGWVSVSLSAPATGLIDGNTYFISIKGTGAGNVYVGVDDAGIYAGGSFDNDGTPELAKDMAFRVVTNPAPVVDLNGGSVGQDETAAFTEQTPVLIAPAGTIVDFDSANLASLTTTLTARPDGDAVESLSLNATAATAATAASLTVSYTAATGVLSITGPAASLATYQTILQGIQYGSTSDAPTTTDRSVMVVASDGANPSTTRTSFVTVAAVNDAPVNTVPGAQTTNEDTARVFSAGGGNAISIADDAGTNPVQVALTGTNGVITLAGTAGLVFSVGDGTADGAMTFTGTVAAINAALDGLSFAPTANFSGAASLSITTNDQGNTGTGGAKSDTDAVAITVTAVNDAPVVDLNAGGAGQDVTAAFTEQTPVLIAPVGTLADVDSANLAALTVTLTARPDGNATESLSATVTGGLAVTYTAATGVLSITGSASVATYQTILQGIQYNNTSEAPTTSARSVTVVANDGAVASATQTSTITVTAVNDAPTVTASGGTTAFTEGGGAVAVDAALAVGDVDNATLASATVSISGGFQGAADALGFTNNPATMGNIAGSYNAATGVLSLSSAGATATLAQWQAALRSVTYTNTSDAPDTANRTVSFVVADGSVASTPSTKTVSVAAVNDAPVNTVPVAQVTNEDTALVFSAGNGNLISIGDIDAGASPVQVTLTATNGAITLAGTAGLTFSAGDGTADAAMTFTGTAGAINTALNGLSFVPTANFSGAASLSITIDDQGNTGAGGALSDTDAVTITVAANNAPTVTASGGTTVFTEGSNVASTPVALDNAVTVSDPDSTTLASATVSIGAGGQAAEDVLGFTGNPATMGNIAGSYNAATGMLSLSSAGATATLAQWEAALRAVTYTNTSDTPNTAARTVSFVVNGDGGSSAASTQSVAVTAVNDAPTVTASSGTATYVTAGATILVDGNVAVSDLDNATLASATVSINGGFRAAEDALGVTNNPATMGNIAGSYNAASGALSLSSAGATATLAQWQAALRSVTYINTSVAPSSATRTVSFVLSDGAALSPVVTRTLAMSVPPVVDPLPLGISPPPPAAPTAPSAPAVVIPPVGSNPPQQTQPTPIAPAGGRIAALDAEFLTPVVDGGAAASSGSGRPQSVAVTNAQVPESRIVAYGIAAPGAEVVRELIADVLKQVEVRQVDLFQLDEQQGRSAGAEGLGGDLIRLRDTLREQDEIQTRTVVTLTAGSLSMTLAYLIWLIRGGALAASVLSALPAWRLLDPLPILARVDDEDDQTGEEDEQSIASFSEVRGDAKRT